MAELRLPCCAAVACRLCGLKATVDPVLYSFQPPAKLRDDLCKSIPDLFPIGVILKTPRVNYHFRHKRWNYHSRWFHEMGKESQPENHCHNSGEFNSRLSN